ncbi:uncharacterized protein BDV14DRAFT_1749 [Aspergillus stella-maris]|uniref:uncharacterized protein n=1 Tax=Aspergillus stella-maris TaxID=1810926 RepID=UPI003CCDE173
MTTHELYIPISGPGLSPQSRSHWSFLLRTPGATYGDLLHVQVIDLAKLWYQFDAREGIDLSRRSLQAEGMVKIADLTAEQRRRAIAVIRGEAAPRDGKRRCQEWIVDALVGLEVEELVEGGMAERWNKFVGWRAEDVKRCMLGEGRWVALK